MNVVINIECMSDCTLTGVQRNEQTNINHSYNERIINTVINKK